ncbi:MAG: hypothetical protein KDA60_05445 [Planctomycetales bacterium]|nr:hypothetical protein [Planctomycetales bacterium]
MIIHEGKPYDFDFDFSRSDRLVCTEVVYRAYDGIGAVQFALTRRAGRPTLSGSDLVQLGVEGLLFLPVLVYAPRLADGILQDQAAVKVMQQALEG